jgi:hypothetical protein
MRLNHRRRRRRYAVPALALALAVSLAAVVPATAKGPVFYPHRCPERVEPATETRSQPWALCGNRQPASATGGGLSTTDAAILGGGVALLVLTIASGMLVATHRRDAHGGAPAAVGAAGGER